MTSNEWTRLLAVPPDAELRRASAILNEAKKPIILAGAGALNAGDELAEIAQKLGAPIIKALLGKAVIPDEHHLSLGGLGLLGTTPAQNAAENCDAIFLVGTTFPYLEYLPKPEDARGVQIDDMSDRIGLRYPVEVGLVGDAKHPLAALAQFIETKSDRFFWKTLRKRCKIGGS